MDKFYVVLIAHCILVFCLLQLVHYSLLFFAAHFVERIAVSTTCLIIILITFRFTRKWCLQDEIDIKNKAVLITGCDSGFGYLLAQQLDKKGFKVFASCLFPCGPGASELKAILSARSKVFGLDVRKQESVLQALEFVKENLESYELWAVVNNAGVRRGFSMELSSVQDFEDCMDVNALGLVRVTKAFLNLLKPSKGRIINVTSICSRLPVSGIVPYTMSKHAAAGFNDCLRANLAPIGIKVISIEPTCFLTTMTEKNAIKKDLEERIIENEEEIMKNYGKNQIENYGNFYNFLIRNISKDVHIVINDLEHAICCQYPESVYNSCPNIVQSASLKIPTLFPSFIQDTFDSITPYIFCKFCKL
ncbi:retinol dehydrogenase 16-like [Argiope bruennichi]|uniref:retinol dehydrogenase 16-like n=1 Tax=Argiope bruennichi TaxID=94029 RepID=UPI0024947C26|nr:retinol dehydrogenase 16-like [Argiope bruennichi]